jgi:hypothetical protein
MGSGQKESIAIISFLQRGYHGDDHTSLSTLSE